MTRTTARIHDPSWWKQLNPRAYADLEERVLRAVAQKVHDPVLQQTLEKLQWLQGNIIISSSSSSSLSSDTSSDGGSNNYHQTRHNNNINKSNATLQVVLRLPSLLYPSLSTLKLLVQRETQYQIQQWLIDYLQHSQISKSSSSLSVTNNTTTMDLTMDESTAITSTTDPVVVEVVVKVDRPIPMMSRLLLNDDNEEQQQQYLEQTLGPALCHVGHVIAVYSCKGGVGKSTVALNLAIELARGFDWDPMTTTITTRIESNIPTTNSRSRNIQRPRIGLLDLDLYGPSLPTLLQHKDSIDNDSMIQSQRHTHNSDDSMNTTTTTTTKNIVRPSPLGANMIYPLEYYGIKLLSLGYVNSESGVPGSGSNNGATIMRGPMTGKVVAQLLKATDWGDLDVLVLDLPPGTGDIHLAVLQELQLTGAVAVTTPSRLAISDTYKGIDMFTSLGVPTLAIVENFSFFECDGGERRYPFGKGIVASGTDSFAGLGRNKIVCLPLSQFTNQANESGLPLCIERPHGATTELVAFQSLAKIVASELLKHQYGQSEDNTLKMVVFTDTSADQFEIETVTLSMNPSNDTTWLVFRIFSVSGALQRKVSPAALRSRDPKTGDLIVGSPFILKEADKIKAPPSTLSTAGNSPISANVVITKTSHVEGTKPIQNKPRNPSLIPSRVERKGRYGFLVAWSDGATVIYSKLCIVRAAGGSIK